jgi:hypothetical protein
MNPSEYQQLFFSTIKRAPGQPADDYAEVLAASGIPAGYGPYIVPDASMPLHGMTQQIGSDGRIAGRVFLPTAAPDPNGYYTHPVSPLRDGPTPGSLLWEWRDLGGPPVVDPSGAAPPDTGGGADYVTREEFNAALAEVVKLGDRIGLQSSGDEGGGIAPALLCAEGGGPSDVPGAFTLGARSGDTPGPWESWKVVKGKA